MSNFENYTLEITVSKIGDDRVFTTKIGDHILASNRLSAFYAGQNPIGLTIDVGNGYQVSSKTVWSIDDEMVCWKLDGESVNRLHAAKFATGTKIVVSQTVDVNAMLIGAWSQKMWLSLTIGENVNYAGV